MNNPQPQKSFFFSCLLISFLIFATAGSSLSQDIIDIQKNEDSLVRIAKKIALADNDHQLKKYNDDFLNLFKATLEIRGSVDYQFDSLKMISGLTDPKRKLRIFTWQLETADKQYQYFGFVQFWDKGVVKVFPLIDTMGNAGKDIESIRFDRNWYGVVYYDLMISEKGDTIILTLLGRRSLSERIYRKVIDFISISGNGFIQFGNSSMFSGYANPGARAIFDYPREVPLTLKFENFIYLKGKRTKKEMIVFNRFSNQSSVINKDIPIPDYGVFDGFVYSDGLWKFIKNIDLRTDNEMLPKRKKKKPKLDLFEPANPKNHK